MTKCSVCESVFQVKKPTPSRVKQTLVATMVLLVLLTLILAAFGAIVWDYWHTRPVPEQSASASPHETFHIYLQESALLPVVKELGQRDFEHSSARC